MKHYRNFYHCLGINCLLPLFTLILQQNRNRVSSAMCGNWILTVRNFDQYRSRDVAGQSRCAGLSGRTRSCREARCSGASLVYSPAWANMRIAFCHSMYTRIYTEFTVFPFPRKTRLLSALKQKANFFRVKIKRRFIINLLVPCVKAKKTEVGRAWLQLCGVLKADDLNQWHCLSTSATRDDNVADGGAASFFQMMKATANCDVWYHDLPRLPTCIA